VDALLNWVWQGSVVAIAAAGMLRALERSHGRTRYRVLCVVLLAILVLPVVPLFFAAIFAARNSVGVDASHEPVFMMAAGWWTSTRIVIGLWTAWVAIFALRVMRATVALHHARRECRPLSPDVETRLARWSDVRMTGRRALLVVSERVTSAAVLAGGTPLIALAPRLLEHLNDEELDRVVIHEWAHVHRRDDVAHLVQLAVATFVGWHPAVWWCSRQLHLEREIASDELAAEVTGSTKAYAACLAKLAALPANSLASLPAVAAMSSSGVRRRIVRVLAFRGARPSRARATATIAAVLVLAIVSLALGGLRLVAVVPAVLHSRLPGDTLTRVAMTGIVEAPRPQSRRIAADPVSVMPSRAPGRPAERRPAVRDRGSADAAAAIAADAAARTTAATSNERPSLLSRSLIAPSSVESLPIAPTRHRAVAAAVETSQPGPAPPPSPWNTAVEASEAVSRRSQTAAETTAGFFNLLGRRIAGAF
jgi:beta-lactamase regulating signal transducer with metallopeptidase domain